MHGEILASLRSLPDAELVARIKDLVARERGATALLVAHLAELDTRDVHLREGHSSLFAYCRDALALSEHEAYNRIESPRRPPFVILDLLGKASAAAVRLLLTRAQNPEVLESTRKEGEVEEIMARLAPRPACVVDSQAPAPLASSTSGGGARPTPLTGARGCCLPSAKPRLPAVRRRLTARRLRRGRPARW
jgi:hypothetical protein